MGRIETDKGRANQAGERQWGSEGIRRSCDDVRSGGGVVCTVVFDFYRVCASPLELLTGTRRRGPAPRISGAGWCGLPADNIATLMQ